MICVPLVAKVGIFTVGYPALTLFYKLKIYTALWQKMPLTYWQ